MNRTITLNDILKMLLQHIRLIIIMSIAFGLIGYIYASYFITPTYSAKSLILVTDGSKPKDSTLSPTEALPTEDSQSSTTQINSVNSILSSQKLANTCSVIFRLDPDMKKIIKGCGINISVESETYFLWINVTSSDPQKAADVANQVAAKAPEVYKKYFSVGAVFTVDEASVPESPSAPNVPQYTIIAFAVGLVLAIIIAFIIEMIDTTIKASDDLYKIYKIPVFAEIIDFEPEGGAKKR